MLTQNELNQRVIDQMDRENEAHLNHAGRMAEWSSVVQTLDPIENMLKVLKGIHHSDPFLHFMTREETVEMFQPRKIR